MQERVGHVELDFRTGHDSEWSVVLVMRPISSGTYQHDFVTERLALGEVPLPVNRHEDLVDRNGGVGPRGTAITEQVRFKWTAESNRTELAGGTKGKGGEYGVRTAFDRRRAVFQ